MIDKNGEKKYGYVSFEFAAQCSLQMYVPLKYLVEFWISALNQFVVQMLLVVQCIEPLNKINILNFFV